MCSTHVNRNDYKDGFQVLLSFASQVTMLSFTYAVRQDFLPIDPGMSRLTVLEGTLKIIQLQSLIYKENLNVSPNNE